MGIPDVIYNLFCKNQTSAVTQARIQSKLSLKLELPQARHSGCRSLGSLVTFLLASRSQESEHSWKGEGIEAV